MLAILDVKFTTINWVQLDIAKDTTRVQLIMTHEYKPEILRLKHLQCILPLHRDKIGVD